ncbi:MAG TPA: PQQ-dependent sugar dehydrogenase [Rhodothermia bacterium]|nr:PQQ-dependent sugar dehydrogenase [Rhodothermia bacterium]
MNLNARTQAFLVVAAASGSFLVTGCSAASPGSAGAGGISAERTAAVCREGQAGLRLPPGFCATIFADSIGAARHLVVAPNGDVFVNLRAGRRGVVASIPAGQVGLRDTNGDGRADVIERFGAAGGTGIGLYNGFLYADHGTSIVRYPLTGGQLRPSGAPETVVANMPGQPGHDARNFAITPDGTLFVNFGSPSNACQVRDRAAGSPGKENCPELLTRAGIWKFDAKSLGQAPSISSRYATGVRNAVALALEPSGKRLFAIPHGRDQLSQNWPALFTPEQNAELPAEKLVELNAGDDFGWPYCYYDGLARQYRLAPEYGGNGTVAGRCERLEPPLYPFPAHWAPNGLLFYTGSQFPAKYRSGIFVAFHGSWNRAPLPQGGFKVVFLPLQNSRANSNFEIFADGFSVENPPPNSAAHRPVGLAQGPDGALYISDDVGGRIWRVTWTGG